MSGTATMERPAAASDVLARVPEPASRLRPAGPVEAAHPAGPRPVAGLLQRACACGGTPGPDGECAECRARREALEAGAQVQRASACEDAGRLDRAAVPGGPRTRRIPPIVREVNRTSGSPLEPALRRRFESSYACDFRDVRVHADDRAARAARAVDARAFTSGNHVVFGRGEFAPDTRPGFRLLAHELAHVVQQRAGTAPPGLSEPGDASEVEAERLAESVERPRAGGTPETPGPAAAAPVAATEAVQRYPGDGMVPPGDCAWQRYLALRAAVEAAKAVVNALGACTVTDTCATLGLKIAAITTEIAARVALDTTCFRGGDTGHRQQVQDKVNMLGRCWARFVAAGCPEYILEAEEAVVAAEEAVTEAEEGAAAVEEVVAPTVELVEGVAATGEAAAEGVTLVEVLEGLGLVLLL